MTRRRARSSRGHRGIPPRRHPGRDKPAAPGRPGVGGATNIPSGRQQANAAPVLRAALATLSLGAALLAATSACPGCEERPASPHGTCAPCTRLLRGAVANAAPPEHDLAWLGPHAGYWRRLVHALKYQNNRNVARFLAELLGTRTLPWAYLPHVVTHVPTTPARVRQRGYDQAELLARSVADDLGVPHKATLTRVRSTKALTGQGRSAREAALRGAFAARPLPGARLLLIDDVLTTGATLRAAKAALQAAGAAEVRCAIVARTSPPHLAAEELEAALSLLRSG